MRSNDDDTSTYTNVDNNSISRTVLSTLYLLKRSNPPAPLTLSDNEYTLQSNNTLVTISTR